MYPDSFFDARLPVQRAVMVCMRVLSGLALTSSHVGKCDARIVESSDHTYLYITPLGLKPCNCLCYDYLFLFSCFFLCRIYIIFLSYYWRMYGFALQERQIDTFTTSLFLDACWNFKLHYPFFQKLFIAKSDFRFLEYTLLYKQMRKVFMSY